MNRSVNEEKFVINPPMIKDVLCEQELLQNLMPKDVLKSYTGKPGCMCGCKGRYYVSKDHREEAQKDRGYDYEDRDVNDRQVMKLLRLLQADDRTCLQDGYILYIPNDKLRSGEKNIVVYLRKK